jgi:hypothetical protein
VETYAITAERFVSRDISLAVSVMAGALVSTVVLLLNESTKGVRVAAAKPKCGLDPANLEKIRRSLVVHSPARIRSVGKSSLGEEMRGVKMLTVHELVV